MAQRRRLQLEKYAAAMHEKTGLRPRKPEIKEANAASDGESRPEGIFTQQVMQQLETVFERMQEPLILELCLDEKAISAELRSYMEELAQLTPKLTVRKSTEGAEHVPLVRVLRSNGSDSGLAFPRGTGRTRIYFFYHGALQRGRTGTGS